MKNYFLLFIAAYLINPLGYIATNLNLRGLSEYTSNEAEINNFSNIIPTDWAFDALNKLAINRDCNFITRKSDSVTSRKNFTRHEAALIIRTCLENVSGYSKEEKRLHEEFRPEIISIENIYNNKNNKSIE
mgnify:CR=1 FL=1